MKIEMLTISSGPDIKLNWNKGEIREVCDDEGNYWIRLGVAVNCEKAIIVAPEKAVIAPKQKAVVQAPETATQSKAIPEALKPFAEAPASSGNTVASAKAATWGTPEVK